jgi:cell division transport system permease protein
MTRINHILKELFRNLVRHPGTALGSILSLLLLFMLFNLFWVTGLTSDEFYRELLSELRVEVFLPESTPDSLIADITRSIISLEAVEVAEYRSRQDAREQLEALMGMDLLVGYDSLNPLPRSLVLTIAPDYLDTDDITDLEHAVARITGSDEIHYGRQWLQKAEQTRSLILELGLGLGALILLTTLISSANNIRLMARARAVGLRQMMLLGAGKLFVGMPFMLEGFLLAGLSAAAAWGLIFYAGGKITFTQFDIVYPVHDDIIAFCLIAAALGGLSGYLGIRKLLR